MFQALFYPLSLAKTELYSLIYGQPVDQALDVVEFAEETGGEAQRELAVPFLAGMDDIEVTHARIALRCGQKLLDIEDYQVRENGSKGVFLSLPRPGRLKKVELSYAQPALPPGQTLRLVVRAASKSGSGFEAGAPLFAAPDLGKLGDMFGRVLGGIQHSSLGGDRWLIALPSVLGDAWLIQLATGDKAEDLAPLAVKPTVNHVTLDAAPRNLSITLAGADGEVKLWNNPEVLLPEAGEQEVSFTPLAQKHLSTTLKAQNKSAGAPALTLPVPLHFHSDSGGAVAITARALEAEYLVEPLGTQPVRLRLAGSPVPVALSTAAGLQPKSSSLRLTVKHLGRELNAASPEPPLAPPAAGLRVSIARQAATRISVAPLAGQTAGSVLTLASARVCLATAQAAEVVLEVRGDLAAAPGPVAAAPVVKQLEAGFSGWVEFELAKPLEVVAGQAPLWLALRVTKGVVDWFSVAGAADQTRVSSDSGETWGAPDPALMTPGELLAQLFHALPGEPPAPSIRLHSAATVLQANLLAGATRKSPSEYSCETALPPQVHALLAATTGQGRVVKELQLFSRAVLDVSVDAAELRYDPFAASGQGA